MRWFLFLVWCSFATLGSANEGFFQYNPSSVEIFKGEVVSVQKFNFANRPAPHIQFILRTDKEDIPVELGPEWYIEDEGMAILPMDKVEVKGSVIAINGKKMIIAESVKKKGYELKLRDDDGFPLWNGWRRN